MLGRRIAAWIFGAGLLGFIAPSYGQSGPDVSSIIHETQIMSQTPDKLTLVWWIPTQFWQASMAKNPALSQTQVEQFLRVVQPYTMVAVVEGSVGAMGGVTYVNEADLRAQVSIEDAAGVRYRPLDDAAIGPDMKNLLMMIRPVIVNLLGPLGQNLHFLVFPGRDKDGGAVASPTGKGFFHVFVSGEDYKYRLPLGSFLPPKFDADSHETFPGNYNFNPYTGSRLVSRQAN